MDADKFSPKEKEVYTELEYQISILRININMFGIKGLKQTFSTQYNTLLCKIENLLGAYFRGPFVIFGLE